jgi:hypothetical protein
MKQIRQRLTYANVMSSIAVFLVLGGATAMAAGQLGKNSVGSKQLKTNAVTAAKIKKGAVTTAKLAGATMTALKGAAGPAGPAGAAGSALGFAQVSDTGIVDPTRSKGVSSANVTHPLAGLYCFSGLGFAPKVAVASPQFYEPKPVALALFMGQYVGCPTGTQVSVQETEEGNVPRSTPFTIIFD